MRGIEVQLRLRKYGTSKHSDGLRKDVRFGIRGWMKLRRKHPKCVSVLEEAGTPTVNPFGTSKREDMRQQVTGLRHRPPQAAWAAGVREVRNASEVQRKDMYDKRAA